MIPTFYFTISWMMLGLLIFNRQGSRGSRMEILFLLMLTCLINTHTYLGLFETFKWMKTTTTPKLYIAFLLYRSLFIPLFVTYITLHIANNTLKKRLFLVLVYCLIIIGTDQINLKSELYDYKKWNLFFTVIYYFLYLFFVMLAFKWFKGIGSLRGENADDVGRR